MSSVKRRHVGGEKKTKRKACHLSPALRRYVGRARCKKGPLVSATEGSSFLRLSIFILFPLSQFSLDETQISRKRAIFMNRATAAAARARFPERKFLSNDLRKRTEIKESLAPDRNWKIARGYRSLRVFYRVWTLGILLRSPRKRSVLSTAFVRSLTATHLQALNIFT